jgi:hypothetical protein
MTESARKSDLHDFELIVHAETDKAYLLSDTGDDEDAKWFPKSQIERDGDTNNFTMPEWLAIEKELF